MKHSTPRLSEVARHVVPPADVVSTGWPSVRDKCRDLDISFRWWQHPVGQIILAKRADGTYASTIGGTGLSIPRQVGKTFLVGAIVFALCLLNPRMTVIWTAHRLRTAEETFGKMQKFAKRVKIAPHIAKVVLGSGEEEIQFENGSRILFGARESGFGLGFDEVDVLIFDEAQRLRDMTLDDMVPATNQSRQPTGALLLFMGTPPRPTDSGEVFTRMRSEALAGEDSDTGWIEFGADPGFTPTPKPGLLTEADWKQVAKANPSYPGETPRVAILRMRKQLTDESFVREGLGIWDEEASAASSFGLAEWLPSEMDVRPSGAPVFFVTIAPEMKSATIAVAALDGARPHVELADHRSGTGWLAGRLRELFLGHPAAAFACYQAGPVKAWLPTLGEFGLDLKMLTSQDAVSAYAHVRNLAESAGFTHSADPIVDDALKRCAWKDTDGGGAVPDWRKSTGDISPFVAEVGALWLLESQPAQVFFASRR